TSSFSSLCHLFFSPYSPHPALHSFPTRRSSDLDPANLTTLPYWAWCGTPEAWRKSCAGKVACATANRCARRQGGLLWHSANTQRSEERRVGKECRYRWARYNEKKKA